MEKRCFELKIIIMLFGIFVLTGLTFIFSIGIVDAISANDSSNNVYQCGTLDSPGVYIMNQSIVPSGDIDLCINITSQNVSLDCNGKTIINETFGAIGISSNKINITIENCYISIGGIGSVGIYLTYSNNSYLINNTIKNSQILLASFFNHNLTVFNNYFYDGGGTMLYSDLNTNITNFYGNATLSLASSTNNSYFNNIHGKVFSFGDGFNNILNQGFFENFSSIALEFGEGSSNNTASNINVINVVHGIRFYESSNNRVFNFTARTNANLINVNPSQKASGIYFGPNSINNTVENFSASGFREGIYISADSHDNNLTDINLSLNWYGIYSFNSLRIYNFNFNRMTLKSNDEAFNLDPRNFNMTFSNVTLIRNRKFGAFNFVNQSLNFGSEIKTLIPNFNFSSNQEGLVGSEINFNITLRQYNGSICLDCSYNLSLFPNETSFRYSLTNGVITGNFTPTKIGIYGLKINLTDNLINFSNSRTYPYFINLTKNSSVYYYFRKTLPLNGQPVAIAGFDSGTLIQEPPLIEEDRHCGQWVQFSPDFLTDYSYKIIRNANFSFWYNTSSDGSVGLERYASYGTSIDDGLNVSITSTSGNKVYENFAFSPNWTIDYPWAWYFFTVKLNGLYPWVYSNSSNSSFINISYAYSDTPAINYISNEDIDVLSATMESNLSGTANLTLDGVGNTTISITMPNVSNGYYVKYDGVSCSSNPNCTIISNSNGIINMSLKLD